jgi:thiol:disulfide interchange protein DsbD
MGLLYVLGLALTYSVIGVVTSLSGALFGELLREPIVLIFIGVVLLGLSLSMFGVYEFKLPDSWVAKAGGSKGGMYGAFFMGLTMGIVAAPCIGPFVLGLVTYVAKIGEPFTGFLLFFFLALGLGTPYFILAIFSGKIKQLPRSGLWMEAVKHIFGFILVGMAIYFVLPIIPKPVNEYILPVYMILAALYILFFDKAANNMKGFKIFKNVLAVAVIAFAVYSFIPNEHETISWPAYDAAQYETAIKEPKPLIIDFSAEWCNPCKELEEITFADPTVKEELQRFTLFKADLTQSGSPEVEELSKQFNVIGVPTILLMNSDGEEVERITGFLPPEDFLKKLEKVK